MKKFLSIMLLFIFVIGLAACGDKITKEPDPPSEEFVITELTEPIVIDTDQMAKITIRDLKASVDGYAIYIKNANGAKIYVEGNNELASTGASSEYNEVVTIISDVDLTLLGDGSLTINSTGSCVKTSGNLTVEDGTYNLTAENGKGLCAENVMIIEDGTITSVAKNCLEATQITINNGKFNFKSNNIAVYAYDKNIDDELAALFTLNKGTLDIEMTDDYVCGVDSHGDFNVHGGTINLIADRTFICGGNFICDGGKLTQNGTELEELYTK